MYKALPYTYKPIK